MKYAINISIYIFIYIIPLSELQLAYVIRLYSCRLLNQGERSINFLLSFGKAPKITEYRNTVFRYLFQLRKIQTKMFFEYSAWSIPRSLCAITIKLKLSSSLINKNIYKKNP